MDMNLEKESSLSSDHTLHIDLLNAKAKRDQGMKGRYAEDILSMMDNIVEEFENNTTKNS